MTIPNTQLRGLGLHPAVPGSKGGDHDAPPALISFAHPWRGVGAVFAVTHISPSIQVLYCTPLYMHGVAVMSNTTEV